jgi:hypothetical protein
MRSSHMAHDLRASPHMVRLADHFLLSAAVATAAGASMLGGCEPDPNAKLADLPNLKVGVIVEPDVDSDDDNTRPSHVAVHVYYDEESFRSTNGACATLYGGHGTINGLPLELDEPGDTDKESDVCNMPYFETDTFFLGPFEAGHLALGDDTVSISADFEGDFFGARIAKPVAPSTWNLRAGEPFAFSWSHTPDLSGITPDDVAIHFKHGVYYGEELTVTEVTDSEIRGIAPAVPEYLGDGTLEILLFSSSSSSWNAATSCTGATACNVSSYRLYDHTAHLAP